MHCSQAGALPTNGKTGIGTKLPATSTPNWWGQRHDRIGVFGTFIPNTAASGAPAIITPLNRPPTAFHVPTMLGVDLSGISDPNGTFKMLKQRHVQVAAVRCHGQHPGERQHRDGFNLHSDRRGRRQEAEGRGQLHRRRQRQRGSSDQRRDPSDHPERRPHIIKL